MFAGLRARRILYSVTFASAFGGTIFLYNKFSKTDTTEDFSILLPPRKLPDRSQLKASLLKRDVFDVLVVGGGATGSGVAYEAANRGLSVALLERGDFASGTSSKSTKLIHGGVRYLQNAVFNLDIAEYRLVREALKERKTLMDNIPNLTSPLPIMLPLYTFWQIPYYYAGLKLYDIVSGTHFLRSSYYLSPSKTKDEFPLLKSQGLRGSIIYYDGQQDDSRVNLTIIMSGIQQGAISLNYMEVLGIKKIKRNNEELLEVQVRDNVTGELSTCVTRCLVNATGPFTDSLRKMYDSEVKPIATASSGTHIIIPKYYCPSNMGMLDAETSDGRVLFLIPWLNHTLAGTTDKKCTVSDTPQSSLEEIEFIVTELNRFFESDIKITIQDVKSAWNGIRPLVTDPNATVESSGTASISRNHVIEVKDKFITISGGKWTTYRAMAEDTILKVLEVLKTKKQENLKTAYYGTNDWTPRFFYYLIQGYGIDEELAKHLSTSYGTGAIALLEGAKHSNRSLTRIHPDLIYTEEEIRYCCRKEYVVNVTDLIGRRTRMAFLNAFATYESLDKICDIMTKELGWSDEHRKIQKQQAEEFINNQMGRKILLEANKSKE